MGFRGSRVQIPPSRLRPSPSRGPCRFAGLLSAVAPFGRDISGQIPQPSRLRPSPSRGPCRFAGLLSAIAPFSRDISGQIPPSRWFIGSKSHKHLHACGTFLFPPSRAYFARGLNARPTSARVLPIAWEMEQASRRILIVEDNFDNLHIYRTLLQHRGFTVLTATYGRAGLAIAKAERPDLVLMD